MVGCSLFPQTLSFSGSAAEGSLQPACEGVTTQLLGPGKSLCGEAVRTLGLMAVGKEDMWWG